MSWVAITAGAALGLSWFFLVVFFVTGRTWPDTLAGVLGLVYPPLIIAVAVHVHRLHSGDIPLVWIVSVVGITAAFVMWLSNGALVLGRIPFDRVAVPATVSSVGLVMWPGLAGWLVVRSAALPAGIGWAGIAVVATGLAALIPWLRDRELIVGRRAPGRLELGVGLPAMVAVPLWFIWLGALL